jgi:MFS family permease
MLRDALALPRDSRLLPVYVGAVLFATVNAGIGAWLVSFLMRVHGFSLPQAGAAIALGLGVFGTTGSLAIGVVADRAESRHPGGLLLTMALCAIANGIAGIAAAAANSPLWAMVALSLWGITAVAYSGPSTAAIGELAPKRLTGVGFSLFSVLCNLIGSGLGPLLAGQVSDIGLPTLGNDSLRPALAVLAMIQIPAAAAYLIAMRRWRASVESA